jgi:soluble lytic murein transglycosylase-like protein
MQRTWLFACAVMAALPWSLSARAEEHPSRHAWDKQIAAHARANLVPEALVHRVIVRESKYNPDLVGHGGTIGLMQLKLATARGVGYAGDADGLRDPETNLKYGIKYLAGAWRAAQGDHDRAMRYFAIGYYYVAKQQRLDRLKQAASAPASAPPKPLAMVAKPQENLREIAEEADAKPAATAKPKPASRKPRQAKAEVPRPPAAVSGSANTAQPR